jgi:hypothetical protein
MGALRELGVVDDGLRDGRNGRRGEEEEQPHPRAAKWARRERACSKASVVVGGSEREGGEPRPTAGVGLEQQVMFLVPCAWAPNTPPGCDSRVQSDRTRRMHGDKYIPRRSQIAEEWRRTGSNQRAIESPSFHCPRPFERWASRPFPGPSQRPFPSRSPAF